MLTLQNGFFEIPQSELKQGVLRLEWADGVSVVAPEQWQPGANDHEWQFSFADGFSGKLSFAGDTVKGRFHNQGNDRFLKKIHLEFAPALPVAHYQEYSHSRLFLEQASGVKPIGMKTAFFEHNPASYVLYLLAPRQGKSGKNILFAALPPHQGEFMVFQAVHNAPDLQQQFGVRITAEEDREVRSGMAFELSELLIEVSDAEPVTMLERLGDLYAARRKHPLKARAVGWNSWDQFHASIHASDVLETQKKLNDFSGGKVRYYVVDDGWQIAYGAWTPNCKFPADLREFCQAVTSEGGIPGVWTAPLCVDNCYMFPDEWIVPTHDGRFALDVTHPNAANYLSGVYRRLYQAGFRYFKVDFTNRLLDVDRLYDMTMGRAGALRKTYELIRAAIGEESYFLGCCVPYEPAFDLVDAVRTTADIQIYWSAVQINMTSASARWWMHRKLWNNDSDFLVVRGSETSTVTLPSRGAFVRGDYASGPVLTLQEAKTLALALYMTGGDLMFSDNFLKLNDAGKQILKDILALPPLPESATPQDLFAMPFGGIPSVWHARQSQMTAFFNWEEDPKTIHVQAADFGASEFSDFFWNPPQAHFQSDKSFSFTLQPHTSIGIRWKK